MKIIILLIRLYALGAGGFLLTRRVIGRRFWLVALVNNFSFWLTLPAVLLAPAVLLWRRAVEVMLLAPTAIYAINKYARRFQFPAKTIPAPDTRTLTVFTYNMHAEQRHLDQIAVVICDSDADIVALQEVSPQAQAHFAEHLRAAYPYQRVHQGSTPTAGQGILSRYPIVHDEYWQNPVNSLVLGHQRAYLDWAGTTIALYNLHPIHPGLTDRRLYSEVPRGQEIEVALSMAAREHSPVIIVGDFNMSEESLDYERITAEYRDVFCAVGRGMGFTFPDHSAAQARADGKLPPIPLRLIRLDYCFISGAWTPVEALVWASAGGSDHRPLRVKLAL